MNIKILCIGKLKENYLRDAQKEYEKRLSRFCKLEILELPEYKLKENASPKEEEKGREEEGNTILSKIKQNDTVIIMDLKGKEYTSEQYADYIEKLGVEGKSSLVFVIGGSTGIAEKVKQRGDIKICFSKMTFPHQLFRIMLLEQTYRAFKIINNETYHK